MRKVLIHQHPQFSYTARVIALEANNQVDEYHHLFGPCLIQGMLEIYKKYFIENIGKNLPGRNYVITANNQVLAFSQQVNQGPYENPRKLSGWDNDPIINAFQSVEDSLHRLVGRM